MHTSHYVQTALWNNLPCGMFCSRAISSGQNDDSSLLLGRELNFIMFRAFTSSSNLRLTPGVIPARAILFSDKVDSSSERSVMSCS